jgi:hypothetical protein
VENSTKQMLQKLQTRSGRTVNAEVDMVAEEDVPELTYTNSLDMEHQLKDYLTLDTPKNENK